VETILSFVDEVPAHFQKCLGCLHPIGLLANPAVACGSIGGVYIPEACYDPAGFSAPDQPAAAGTARDQSSRVAGPYPAVFRLSHEAPYTAAAADRTDAATIPNGTAQIVSYESANVGIPADRRGTSADEDRSGVVPGESTDSGITSHRSGCIADLDCASVVADQPSGVVTANDIGIFYPQVPHLGI